MFKVWFLTASKSLRLNHWRSELRTSFEKWIIRYSQILLFQLGLFSLKLLLIWVCIYSLCWLFCDLLKGLIVQAHLLLSIVMVRVVHSLQISMFGLNFRLLVKQDFTSNSNRILLVAYFSIYSFIRMNCINWLS